MVFSALVSGYSSSLWTVCLDESTGKVLQIGEQDFGINSSFHVFDRTSRNLYCVHEKPKAPGMISRWKFSDMELKFIKEQVGSLLQLFLIV